MDYIMWAIIVVGILLLILRKRNKVYNWILIIFMIFTFVYSSESMDSYAYEQTFEGVCDGKDMYQNPYGIDFGFIFFMKVVSLFTNEYLIFRFIVAFISFFLMLLAMKKIDSKNSMNLILYFLFPFAYDVFQIEFFLAYAIVVYALVSVIKEECSIIKYLFFIFIAYSIHTAILPMLIYIILFIDIRKINWRFVGKIAIGGFILLFLLNFVFRINFVKILVNVLPVFKEYVGGYVNSKSINTLHIIIILVMYMLMLYFTSKIKNESRSTGLIYILNCLSLVFLPMLFVTLDFERLLRPLLIINYAYIHNYAKVSRKNLRYLELILTLIVMIRFCLYYDYYLDNNYYLNNLFIK